MRHEIKLPELGEDSGDAATVAYWLVAPGDTVKEGQDLAELTTDKAAFSVASTHAGTVLELLVQEGAEIKTGDAICVVEA